MFPQEDDTGAAHGSGPNSPPVDLEDEAEAEGEEHRVGSFDAPAGFGVVLEVLEGGQGGTVAP